MTEPAGPFALLTSEDQVRLLERIEQGDAAAEADLVFLFERRILATVLSRTRDREVARDIVQDVLLAVLVAVRERRVRHGDRLGAFVYGTARNLVNKYFRSRGLEPAICELVEESAAVNPSTDVEQADQLRLVQCGLARLEDLDRRILLMTLMDGLEPQEIAARLDISGQVVRSRKSRALRKVIAYVKKRSQAAPVRYFWKKVRQ